MSNVAILDHTDATRVPVPAATTPMEMVSMALDRGAPPETLEKLLALQERWEAGQARKAFNAAVADAKAEFGPVIKNAKGHNGQYADFSAYAKALDSTLAKYGLNYRFRTTQADRIIVTCILSHRDGYSEENSLAGPADTSGNKNGIQAIGSTQTYLMRYTLIGALGLSSVKDDDGTAASKAVEDAATITPEQIAQIEKALEFRGRTVDQLLQRIKVRALEDILASKFGDVMALISKGSASNG